MQQECSRALCPRPSNFQEGCCASLFRFLCGYGFSDVKAGAPQGSITARDVNAGVILLFRREANEYSLNPTQLTWVRIEYRPTSSPRGGNGTAAWARGCCQRGITDQIDAAAFNACSMGCRMVRNRGARDSVPYAIGATTAGPSAGGDIRFCRRQPR
jgi:hypothetical protein